MPIHFETDARRIRGRGGKSKEEGKTAQSRQEERLHSVLQKTEEMMQLITMKVECLEHQNISVLQEESSDIHEQTCHKIDDVFIQPYVKEQSPDILYEYNSFPSFNFLPKYNEYDDDYEPNDQISLPEESDPILAESTVHVQQLEPCDQLAHFSYEEEEENAENFEASKGTLPFCFKSFQFIKENYHAINKQVSASVDIDRMKDDQIIVQNVLPLVLQPQRAVEYQIEEDLETAAYDQMIKWIPCLFVFSHLSYSKKKKRSSLRRSVKSYSSQIVINCKHLCKF